MHSERVITGGSNIEKQLDDLFGQDSPTDFSPGDSKKDSPTGLSPSDSKKEIRSASPLTSLKSIVLSMDWEINDPILKEFVQELNRLKAVFQANSKASKHASARSCGILPISRHAAMALQSCVNRENPRNDASEAIISILLRQIILFARFRTISRFSSSDVQIATVSRTAREN